MQTDNTRLDWSMLRSIPGALIKPSISSKDLLSSRSVRFGVVGASLTSFRAVSGAGGGGDGRFTLSSLVEALLNFFS